MNVIQKIGVIGGGQMGQGIAQVAAQSGHDVVILDASIDLATQAVTTISTRIHALQKKGKCSEQECVDILNHIQATDSYNDLSACQFVIEAVTEKQSIKESVFASCDKVLDKDAILASNTSSISITALAATTTRAEQCIGMHFMNPVPLMKLVEIIPGLATNEETKNTTLDFAKKLGKETIVSRDVPGFIVNRVLIPLINEACFAVYEGIGTADDIDKGVLLGLNHPMGPLALADLIGLDTCLYIAEVLHRELGDDKYRPCPLLRQYVSAGWLGRKSKQGFYSYQ